MLEEEFSINGYVGCMYSKACPKAKGQFSSGGSLKG